MKVKNLNPCLLNVWVGGHTIPIGPGATVEVDRKWVEHMLADGTVVDAEARAPKEKAAPAPKAKAKGDGSK